MGNALQKAMKQRPVTYKAVPQRIDGRQLEIIKKAEYDKGYNDALRNVWSEVEKEWQNRQKQFMDGGYRENLYRTFVLLVSIPVTILIEDFGWKDCKRKKADQTNLAKFLNLTFRMLECVGSDEDLDIRRYAANVEKKYGIDLSCFDDAFLQYKEEVLNESKVG